GGAAGGRGPGRLPGGPPVFAGGALPLAIIAPFQSRPHPRFERGVSRVVYSVGEVAERLGVHWRTLHNWERAGLVRPARAGGRRVYSERDLAELRRALFLTPARRLSPRAAAPSVPLDPPVPPPAGRVPRRAPP